MIDGWAILHLCICVHVFSNGLFKVLQLSGCVIVMCLVCCVATVKECVQNLSQEDDKENLVASLWGAERCLRVLESVSTALSSSPSLTAADWMVTFSVT